MLKPLFAPETEAILAIEEPEAHLHPHASRALAKNLQQIQYQKIISSHSPYFIQEIPFGEIRMFRKKGNSIQVFYLKDTFSIEIPQLPTIKQFCENRTEKYFHDGISTLTVKGRVNEEEDKKLIKCCLNHPDDDKNAKNIAL